MPKAETETSDTSDTSEAGDGHPDRRLLEGLVIEMVDLDDLKPDPDNPRNNTGAISMVAQSIRDFGFLVPIVVNKESKIVAGHARYMAARMLGLQRVPCVRAEHLTPEQERAFSIAENRTSDFSFFDTFKLAEMVTELSDEYIANYDLESLLSNVTQPAEMPEEQAPPEKRPGLDLAPFEKYQYVTIICRTTYDYENLLERLGLENVQARYVAGVLKRGSSYGRIIEYAEFLEKVGWL